MEAARTIIRRLALSIMVTASGLGIGASVSAAIPPDQDAARAFRMIATQLMEGISRADLSDIPARGGYGAPRVAVWPFDAQDVQVPPELASEYNDHLLAALGRGSAGRIRLVARETLKTLIRDIETLGDGTGTTDARIRDLLGNASVDILVVGKMRRDGDDVILSYKALSGENGTIFAATEPQRIPAGLDRRPAMATLSLDRAVRAASRDLAARMPGMTALRVVPLSSADGKRERPLGAYFSERVADGLRTGYLRRGIAPHLRLMRDGDAARPGEYRLGGTYWALGSVVEVRLTLSAPGGETAEWRDRIRTETIPTALLRQPGGPPPVAFLPPALAPPLGIPAVAETQRLLMVLGYDPGPADGALSPRTRRAIGAYQRDAGLEVNGRMTRSVVQNLRRAAR